MDEYGIGYRRAGEQAVELAQWTPPAALAVAKVQAAGESAFAALGAQIRAFAVSVLTAQAAQIQTELRVALPVMLASEQWTEFDRNVKAMANGRWLALADQISLAMDAGLAQLAEFNTRPAAPPHHTRSAHLTITPTFTVTAEVTKAAETEPASIGPVTPSEAGRSINVVACAILLVILLALATPEAEKLLPHEVKDYLDHLYGPLSLALGLIPLILHSREH